MGRPQNFLQLREYRLKYKFIGGYQGNISLVTHLEILYFLKIQYSTGGGVLMEGFAMFALSRNEKGI